MVGYSKTFLISKKSQTTPSLPPPFLKFREKGNPSFFENFFSVAKISLAPAAGHKNKIRLLRQEKYWEWPAAGAKNFWRLRRATQYSPNIACVLKIFRRLRRAAQIRKKRELFRAFPAWLSHPPLFVLLASVKFYAEIWVVFFGFGRKFALVEISKKSGTTPSHPPFFEIKILF